ncbi:hypothetical protein ACFL4G_10500, partial [Thermodesulfobacteriota bacterium]
TTTPIAWPIAALVSSCYSGDLALMSRCVPDEVVTPVRAELIPGSMDVIDAAMGAGALGSSISGSGPSIYGKGLWRYLVICWYES